MLTIYPDASRALRPHPWLSLLLVSATTFGACLLPGLWITGNYLLLKAVGAAVVVVVFVWFTLRYGGSPNVSRSRGLLPVLMLASPWLFAAVNVCGETVPSLLLTSAALTALLVALLIGVAEELLYRGILFRAFQERSAALYVLASSLTFGLFHFSQGYQGVVTTLVVGSSYALARVAGSPLSLLIVCHAVTDFPNLFTHTPHSYYRWAAFGAVVAVAVLTVVFISRRGSWDVPQGPPSGLQA